MPSPETPRVPTDEAEEEARADRRDHWNEVEPDQNQDTNS